MTMIKKSQIQRIYAMGARLGVLESGNKDDMLHSIVFRITNKESIRSLTEQEYYTVTSELADRLKRQNLGVPTPHPYKKKRFEESGRGMMSDGQQRKVWRLMYQLEELDDKPSTARLGDRLCGIIRKELHIDCVAKQPFRWLTYQQGVKLIEILKKYVANRQRRKAGAGKAD